MRERRVSSEAFWPPSEKTPRPRPGTRCTRNLRRLWRIARARGTGGAFCSSMKQPFKTDIEMIRKSAREKMQQGAVTESYLADRDKVIDVLNEVLATEIVCTLRYRNHYFLASGIF